MGEQVNKAASWFPIPVRLVDEVMPRLRDTELRVLLVVLRQTDGWKADRADTGRGRPQRTKSRDWISHRQLCRRTGRGSDAVSSAVASLTAAGLLMVEDAAGQPLLTPEQRRRSLGRLYYRLRESREAGDMKGDKLKAVEMWITGQKTLSGKSRNNNISV